MPVLLVVALAIAAGLGIFGVFDKYLNSSTPTSKSKEILYFAILCLFVGLAWFYLKSTIEAVLH